MDDPVKPMIKYQVDKTRDFFLQLLKNIYITSGFSGDLKKVKYRYCLCLKHSCDKCLHVIKFYTEFPLTSTI